MYGKGGWVFVPQHPKLPIRSLSAEEQRANIAARQDYERKCEAIRDIYRWANEKLEPLGSSLEWDDDEYGPSYPELVLPYDEHEYDLERFTQKDHAVLRYGSGWETPRQQELDRLKAMVKAGVEVYVAFQGCSAASMSPRREDFERDGPPVPDFVNDNWWRGTE